MIIYYIILHVIIDFANKGIYNNNNNAEVKIITMIISQILSKTNVNMIIIIACLTTDYAADMYTKILTKLLLIQVF